MQVCVRKPNTNKCTHKGIVTKIILTVRVTPSKQIDNEEQTVQNKGTVIFIDHGKEQVAAQTKWYYVWQQCYNFRYVYNVF